MNSVLHPTLLVDRQKCYRNLRRMKSRAEKNGILLRPHFKTHQSGIIGEIFKENGIRSNTVSSVQMALQFIYSGWKDITVAIPFNIRETPLINRIPEEVNINLLVDSIECIEHLDKHLQRNAGFFIEIDTGYHRTGLATDDHRIIDKILGIMSPDSYLHFKGFLTHAGNTYLAGSKNEILDIFKENKKQLRELKEKYHKYCPLVSFGDTPSCSLAEDFEGIDEIRPGNFIYYDLMQYELGSCTLDDIAVTLACPVISKNKSREEIVIYGGAVHLSKEFLLMDGKSIYGLPVPLTKKSWGNPYPGSYVSGLSQEHGIIRAGKELFESINIGDLLGIIPIHSCLTANLMKDSTLVLGS